MLAGFTLEPKVVRRRPTAKEIAQELKLREEDDQLMMQSRKQLFAQMFPDCYAYQTSESTNPFGCDGASLENFF